METIQGDPPQLQPTVETCPFRRSPADDAKTSTATCDLIDVLLNEPGGDTARVEKDVCLACCRSFPPTLRDLNPVVASIVYTRATQLAEVISGEASSRRLRRAREVAREALDLLYVEPLELPLASDRARQRLSSVLPPPRFRRGRRVRDWAVGVTTSPRIQATLEPCLDGLLRAGWDRPQLFIDGPVRVADRHASLPATYRRERVGAWPNYFLALAELLLLRPRAEAFMIVQDDALFCESESLPKYLEHVLWPSREPCLVSLYCCVDDQAPRPGWREVSRVPVTGPVALVFPPEIAKSFVTDFAVFEHRWQPDEKAATSLGDLIATWCHGRGIATWFPTPSLVRHIGDTSTLWPGARASGARQAGKIAGDP